MKLSDLDALTVRQEWRDDEISVKRKGSKVEVTISVISSCLDTDEARKLSSFFYPRPGSVEVSVIGGKCVGSVRFYHGADDLFGWEPVKIRLGDETFYVRRRTAAEMGHAICSIANVIDVESVIDS